MNEFENDEDIDVKIIKEKNLEIKSLEEDLNIISQIFQDLSEMVEIQGEKIDYSEKNIENTEKNVEVSVNSLENSLNYSIKYKNFLRDIGIIGGGLSLNSLGFLLGPVVGSITLITGATAGTGIIFINKKLKNE